jgi:hypothetical protein
MTANAVIPSYVDLNIYNGMQIKFDNLNDSPSKSGALLGDGMLSFDLSNSYTF